VRTVCVGWPVFSPSRSRASVSRRATEHGPTRRHRERTVGRRRPTVTVPGDEPRRLRALRGTAADAVLTNRAARFVRVCVRSTCAKEDRLVTAVERPARGDQVLIKRDREVCAPKAARRASVCYELLRCLGMGGCAMTTTNTTTTLPCQYFGGLAGAPAGAPRRIVRLHCTTGVRCIMLGGTTTSTLPPECSTCGSLVPSQRRRVPRPRLPPAPLSVVLSLSTARSPGTSCDTVQS